MALALVASMAGLGCGHTLSFGRDRYEVRVTPLTANAHKYEEVKVGAFTLSLDEMVVPYDWHGNWASTMGIWPDGDGYANVMATVFVHVDGYRISAADVDANAMGLSLADSLKGYAFVCGAPASDAAAGLSGVKVECEAPRRKTDVQKLRARALWAPDGLIFQVVTWTVGSKTAADAETFWSSLRVSDSAESASPNARSVAVAALPVDAVVSHAFGRRQ